MYFFALVAAAVACYFAVAAWQRPRPGVIIAAIVWLLYVAYEVMIANECDGKCNIRADVILVGPLLWLATLFGIYAPGQWTVAGKVQRGLSIFLVASMEAMFLYMVLVENPAAERRAAREKACGGQAESGRECPPATPSAGK